MRRIGQNSPQTWMDRVDVLVCLSFALLIGTKGCSEEPTDASVLGRPCVQVEDCNPDGDPLPEAWCEFPVGDCGSSGTCVERPTLCSLESAPVCGCDGVTYIHACAAQAAGVGVASEGACLGQTGGWMIERVDDAANQVLTGVSIAIDPAGLPHIANGLHASQRARYGNRYGGRWTMFTIDEYKSGFAPALAFDPVGRPCIVYFASRGDIVRFARLVDSTWRQEQVDDLGLPGFGTGFAFAPDGTAHVAYAADFTLHFLRHAYKVYVPLESTEVWPIIDRPEPMPGWRLETVDPDADSGSLVDLVLDADRHPHILHLFTCMMLRELRYSTWDGAAWHHEVITDDIDGVNPIQAGLALSDSGVVHAAWFTLDPNAPELRHGVRGQAGWNITTVDEDIVSSAACSLVIDPRGDPHIVYGTQYNRDSGWSQLMHATRRGDGLWMHETVDGDGDVGELNDLAIDGAGVLHVAYFRSPGGRGGEIRYARSTSSWRD